jgi:FkbM family methyltransferase
MHTLLQVNHGLHELTFETNNRLKNSGTITISDHELLTKIFSGLKMYLDPRDLSIAPHIALDSIWEHDITIAWLKVVGVDDTIVDIGANYGYFGALAGQKTSAASKIVFFEANPHLIPYIRKTLAANWLMEKSRVENMAMSDRKGKVTFNISPYYLGSASLSHELSDASYAQYKIQEEKLNEVTVSTVSLDEYCKDHDIKAVDLIKMDIEGFEETAYKGMRKIVKASPNATLFIEFTKGAYKQPEKFYDQMLADFGNVYTITKDGDIVKPKQKSYDSVVGEGSDWVMPIFSKRSNLDKL